MAYLRFGKPIVLLIMMGLGGYEAYRHLPLWMFLTCAGIGYGLGEVQKRRRVRRLGKQDF